MAQLAAGARFKEALAAKSPLQIVGAINAYCALLAQHSGFSALYLSGAGVANACYGLPDLGMTSLTEVAEEARRITAVTQLPLLVDVDTGWGHAFNIARTIKTLEAAGVAAIHIEDQVGAKRCGHRPGKAIVSSQEMVDRIKAAVDARTDRDFIIMARTDAIASEGLSAALDRMAACREAGADMVFPEAVRELAHYQQIAQHLKIPVLANITEFGQTPLFTREQLAAHSVAMILYPLSAFRAMSKAALNVYQTIARDGTAQAQLANMQTREELYQHLNYMSFEKKLDELFATSNKEKNDDN